MAKIFQTQFQKGSLIDSATGSILSNTDTVFKRTDKGVACLFNGSTSILSLAKSGDIAASDFSAELWFKTGDDVTTTQTPAAFRPGTNFAIFRLSSGNLYGNVFDGTLRGQVKTISAKTWYHAIITWDSTSQTCLLYLNTLSSSNGTLGGFTGSGVYLIGGETLSNKFSGYVGKVALYDSVLNSSERDVLYQNFLTAQSLGEAKRNFSDNKPTDLSSIAGLVAAYNMEPDGGIESDISGNGYNGTPKEITRLPDGIRFGDYSNVTLSPSLDIGTANTICMRIRIEQTLSYPLYQDFLSYMYYTDTPQFSVTIVGSTFSWTAADGLFSLIDKVVSIVIVRNYTDMTLYIDGVSYGTKTQSFATANSQYTYIGGTGSGSAKYIGEMYDMKFYNYAFNENEAKDYHNEFANKIHFKDEALYERKDGIDRLPLEWTTGTATVKAGEIAQGEQNLSEGIDVFDSYYEWTGNGTLPLKYTKSTDVDCSYIWYTGSAWSKKEDTLTNLITSESYLSQSGDYLVFTGVIGDRLAKLTIRKGIQA